MAFYAIAFPFFMFTAGAKEQPGELVNADAEKAIDKGLGYLAEGQHSDGP